MRDAPHQDEFDDRERKCAATALWYISECQCPPVRAPIRGRFAIDAHCASARRQQAEDCLEQCRFAFAVAPENAQHFTGTDSEADVAADGSPGIAITQILKAQSRGVYDHAERRLKARSHRKTGVPSAAARTPSGSSTIPIVRATVSTASR